MSSRTAAQLCHLLNSDDVDVRVAAGECLALLFEVGREVEGEDFNLQTFAKDIALIDLESLLDKLFELCAGNSVALAFCYTFQTKPKVEQRKTRPSKKSLSRKYPTILK
jgi:hypothetical protein